MDVNTTESAIWISRNTVVERLPIPNDGRFRRSCRQDSLSRFEISDGPSENIGLSRGPRVSLQPKLILENMTRIEAGRFGGFMEATHRRLQTDSQP